MGLDLVSGPWGDDERFAVHGIGLSGLRLWRLASLLYPRRFERTKMHKNAAVSSLSNLLG